MKILSTTNTRKHLAEIVADVSINNTNYIIGRRNTPEAVIIPFPKHFSPNVSEVTLFAANSGAFDFLAEEPDIYSK